MTRNKVNRKFNIEVDKADIFPRLTDNLILSYSVSSDHTKDIVETCGIPQESNLDTFSQP